MRSVRLFGQDMDVIWQYEGENMKGDKREVALCRAPDGTVNLVVSRVASVSEWESYALALDQEAAIQLWDAIRMLCPDVLAGLPLGIGPQPAEPDLGLLFQ